MSLAGRASPAAAPRVRSGLTAGGARMLATQAVGEAGERLPAAVQAKMERAFRFDFSAVRIYQDDQAERAGALAFAQGLHLHFAPGWYSPESSAGQEILGHELAHVVQQADGRVHASAQAHGGASGDDPVLEREADEMGRTAASGGSVAQKAPGAAEPLESRLARVMGRRSEEQPIQRMVQMPPDSNLPSFHEYLTKSGDIYSYDRPIRTKGELLLEVFTSLFHSPRVFRLKGKDGESAEVNLMRHIDARQGVVAFAADKEYKFTGGRAAWHMNPEYWEWDASKGTYWAKDAEKQVEASKDLKKNPKEYTIGCSAATRLTVEGGGDSRRVQGSTADERDWVPGESGYIKNEGWDGRPGLEGENIIYMGGKRFWGHFEDAVDVQPYRHWFEMVDSWNDHTAKLESDRSWPSKGLK
ncbi:MAG: DUF4157 domain-containing protein [Planctomycetota bacterium]|nr:MAG: DUF4157 domain-containing protein [Planctomycetota bacterium]